VTRLLAGLPRTCGLILGRDKKCIFSLKCPNWLVGPSHSPVQCILGWKGNAYRVFFVKSEVKRPFGSPRYRFLDSIIMDLKNRLGGHELNLAYDRDMPRSCEHSNEPSGSVSNFWTNI